MCVGVRSRRTDVLIARIANVTRYALSPTLATSKAVEIAVAIASTVRSILVSFQTPNHRRNGTDCVILDEDSILPPCARTSRRPLMERFTTVNITVLCIYSLNKTSHTNWRAGSTRAIISVQAASS